MRFFCCVDSVDFLIVTSAQRYVLHGDRLLGFAVAAGNFFRLRELVGGFGSQERAHRGAILEHGAQPVLLEVELGVLGLRPLSDGGRCAPACQGWWR